MTAAARMQALAEARPEWAAWLALAGEVTAELCKPVWDGDAPVLAAPGRTPTDEGPAAKDGPALTPWLAGAMLRPDGNALADLLERLTRAARASGLHGLAGEPKRAPTGSPDDAGALFLAAVNGSHERPDLMAARCGASPDGFRTIAHWLAMPYLYACTRRWTASGGSAWSQGYCPVCGAWPSLAELRGIERTRHLRCGRCGASWPMPVLACTYCANSDHKTLGTLVAEDGRSRLSVEVCRGCSGYLKSANTLQATPADELLAADLASVEFDLVAVDRGFMRPPGTGFALHARLGASQPAARPARHAWPWAWTRNR